MSLSTRPSIWKRIATVGLLAAAGVGLIAYVQEFAKIDPLVNMRKRTGISPDQLGISLGKVKLVQYSGKRRVGMATVDELFIPANRSQYRMTGITEGAYFTENNRKFNFTAPSATYNATRRTMVADKGVRVWDKDIDLKTAMFRLNQKSETLYIPGEVKGKFFSGQLVSNNMLYAMKNDLVTVGPTNWNGNLALSLQDEAKPVQKRWEFDSVKGTFNIKGDLRTWEKGTATDGEIIIQADKIEHNNKTDVVTATGNVRYFSARANLTCEKAVIFRKEKRAVLTGAVDMLIKPKKDQSKAMIEEIPPFKPVVPEEVAKSRPGAPAGQKSEQQKKLDDNVQNPKTIRDYPMVVTAAKVEYWYGRGSRRAVITGDPQARQELPEGRWRHLWAFQAFYDGEKETLRMESRQGQMDTRLLTSVGDDVVAEQVTVSTKEDDEDLEAKGMKGTIFGKSDDDEVGPPPPDPIKPKTGGGGLSGTIGR